ncbi:hypothetical protein ABZ897_59235 [Nonomuraea sp. NPDC046802]|uniref:hypothetical protein n=1 Tax=Nonomuraea sp. NPDC046802 TaxID=3154919 RepID=UPI0034062E2C
MNRVVKTAVAVTAFGLAAALAVPAQADVRHNNSKHNTSRSATLGDSPVGGILGGLVGSGLLTGLLGATPKSAALPDARALPDTRMSEIERDRASEAAARQRTQAEESGFTANAAEDVISGGAPLRELSPIVGGFALGQAGLTKSLPVLGAARMAQPATPAVKGGAASQNTDVYGSVSGLVDSSIGGTMFGWSSGRLLPEDGNGLMNTGKATVGKTAKGFESLSAETALGGLSATAKRALPRVTSGELAPVVGQVAPKEVAPVVEALPGTTQTASAEELKPIVKDASTFVETNGYKAADRYGDVMVALGWSSESLAGSVRESWKRD